MMRKTVRKLVSVDKLRIPKSHQPLTGGIMSMLRSIPSDKWQPIVVVNGTVKDGAHRVLAARELGIKQITADITTIRRCPHCGD